jgi:hypothetical protein
MNEDLTVLAIIVGIAHSGLRLATPYLYAAIGEMFSQRSGVLNLGVEGGDLQPAVQNYVGHGRRGGRLWRIEFLPYDQFLSQPNSGNWRNLLPAQHDGVWRLCPGAPGLVGA